MSIGWQERLEGQLDGVSDPSVVAGPAEAQALAGTVVLGCLKVSPKPNLRGGRQGWQ